ncbi:hypothetical protein SPRG_03426 [Saprolegnia parasitica CBS 223.65]|uniref:RING-type domain-containing protein n=1 Tax=Saprolegnia parasitica (strain CBS 223.65) TaxID=695850 RepID=A0A067CNG9_SAPPC|nr:hypothetical protein SPRG_03426 [Saprolegnia parasitica CBS 223.65]KDO32209.1 hypothetical protein SPRG_03426 [Saprolegnia parasitica CBS 223.65]|eukprot:XP_012197389.1 hypothetical protein SPRG_03426 [Saprolegnia parasitica CBS 223.65]
MSSVVFVLLALGLLLLAVVLRPTTPSPTAAPSRCSICWDALADRVDHCGLCTTLCCTPCLRVYLQRKAESPKTTFESLACVGCARPLTKTVLRELLPPRLYATLCKRLAPRDAATCPRRGCDGTLYLEVGRSRWFFQRRAFCSRCLRPACLKCGKAYHCLPTCADRRFEAYCRAHNVQTCPQCYRYIQRSGGCHYMACIKCSHAFCWKCRLPWRFGHTC